ncbi:hypothetical protein [Streptomyces albipurpureus]|uniref:Uncharacterized protein n=1 Tax=Streptomyces albipurpureus TaxID=2897419 RepID=A0ABT0V2N7_9ACTN|nr:hypothetical protein [Streptomyces sp. CWNU-1]MCM2394150.1 hypothetical protein [Streptomyces sp. CWNU-1]
MSSESTVVAMMWEARAVRGRGVELLEWARAQELAVEPLRRESFRASQDRVLVITWWAVTDPGAPVPELPEPAADLITRPVHRWRFESLGTDGG